MMIPEPVRSQLYDELKRKKYSPFVDRYPRPKPSTDKTLSVVLNHLQTQRVSGRKPRILYFFDGNISPLPSLISLAEQLDIWLPPVLGIKDLKGNVAKHTRVRQFPLHELPADRPVDFIVVPASWGFTMAPAMFRSFCTRFSASRIFFETQTQIPEPCYKEDYDESLFFTETPCYVLKERSTEPFERLVFDYYICSEAESGIVHHFVKTRCLYDFSLIQKLLKTSFTVRQAIGPWVEITSSQVP